MPTFTWYLPEAASPAGGSLSQTDLGIDIACINDIGPKMRLVSGAYNVACALARRFQTRRGGLFYAPNYGYSLTQFVNSDLDNDTLSTIRAGVINEALKDERVYRADARVSWNPTEERLLVEIYAQSSQGPFKLIMAASSVSAEILRIES